MRRDRPSPWQSWWPIAFALLFFHGYAYAQNFSPIAQAATTTTEVLVNQTVTFSSAGSIDPDSGPNALTFAWDFGDGGTSTAANPSHPYLQSGAFTVQLTVTDGAASGIARLTVFVLSPVTATRPTQSSSVTISADGRRLWIANPDSNSITVLDITGVAPQKLAEVSVGKNPRTLALSSDEKNVFVACQDSNELWVIDAADFSLIRKIRVGSQPYGVAVSANLVLISNQASNTITVLNTDLSETATLPVEKNPRAIVISADGTRAYATHFLTRGNAGAVSEIALNTLTISKVILLAEDAGPDSGTSGKGFPNMLSAATIDPAGNAVWIGGLKSNTNRGTFVSGQPLLPVNRTRGVMILIDAATRSEDVLRRIDTDDADSASSIAFSRNGRHAFVTHTGAGRLSVYDILSAASIDTTDGSPIPPVARIELGHAPQGCVLSPDGQRLYVSNYLSRSVMAVDVSNPGTPSVVATVYVTAEPLTADVANGKRLFYRSREPQHSKENYIACISCHADGGGHDGRTWDFTQAGEGLRNTIDLRARGGTDHGPVHWSANFDEIQDFENDIVHGFGGTGLAQDGSLPNAPLGTAKNAGRNANLDDLSAYVRSLKAFPRSPHRKVDGTLTDSASRGKSLFTNQNIGCLNCHGGPRFTDSVLTPDPANFILHDVGTLKASSGKRLGGTLPGIDTPSLIGAYDSEPYLHDGSAARIIDVLTTLNPQDKHGVTSQLSAAQLNDLTEYILSIDGSSNDVAPVIQSIGCSTSNAAVGQVISFGAAAFDGDGDTLAYFWDFGDGLTESGTNAQHVYTTIGVYVVTLTVTDAGGTSTLSFLAIRVDAANAINALRFSGRLNAGDDKVDECRISGEVRDVPVVAMTAGCILKINVGGAVRVFSLDAKGGAKTADGMVKLRFKRPKNGPTKANVSLSIALKDNFENAWLDEGFLTKPAQSSSMNIDLELGTSFYSSRIRLIAKQSGSAIKLKQLQ